MSRIIVQRGPNINRRPMTRKDWAVWRRKAGVVSGWKEERVRAPLVAFVRNRSGERIFIRYPFRVPSHRQG